MAPASREASLPADSEKGQLLAASANGDSAHRELSDSDSLSSDEESGAVQPRRSLRAKLNLPERTPRLGETWMCSTPAEATITALVCLGYSLFGPLLILSNKYLLTRAGFPYPLLVTCLTQAVTSLIAFLVIRVFRAVQLEHDLSWSFYATHVASVGLAGALALCTGNAAYLFNSMAFVEILKGFAPVVTMMVQAMLGDGIPRRRPAIAVMLIFVGTTVASSAEMHLNVVGMLVMLASVYFEAVRLILTQRLLSKHKLHVIEGLYYICPVSLGWVAAASVFFDLQRFDTAAFVAGLPSMWPALLMTGLLGFATNTASFLVITRTNIIMLKLLSIARNALVVISGVVLYRESLAPMQICGYVMTLIFFGYYNYVQLTPHLDDAPARAPALAPSPRRSRDDDDSDSSSSADGV